MCRLRPKFQRPSNHVLASGAPRGTQKAVTPQVAQKAISGPFGLQEPSWGPRRPLSVVSPALSVVFELLPAGQAAVRAERDLDRNGRPLRSFVIAVLEGRRSPLLIPARLAAS